MRPKTGHELKHGAAHTIELLKDQTTLIFDPSDPSSHEVSVAAGGTAHRQKNVAFCFDCVLGPEANQEQVYDRTARDTIPAVLDGFNASVFAYGQTSAGKTFTMLGDRERGEGVMVRAMRDLFAALEQEAAKRQSMAAAGRSVDYSLTFSYLEVYNEMIFDLLSESPPPAGGLDLQDGTDGEVVVQHLSEEKPKSVEHVMSLLERGNARRAQSATDANENSSRSHAVLQIQVRRTEKKSVGGKVKTIIRKSKLSMIDLAGSERAKATVGREASLRKEGQNINKSLLALGSCINALSQGMTHVPFRDSKLTRLLKDTLGGNCKTVMIANVSPCVSNFEDTYSTLNYAKRAKTIKVTLTKAQLAVASASDNFNLAQIEALREENERLKEMLRGKGPAAVPPTVSIPTAPVAPPIPPAEEQMQQCLAACGAIQKQAEQLYGRRLGFHKLAFSAWVKCQWARVRVQLLAHQMESCRDKSELQALQRSKEAAESQMSVFEFDMSSSRRQIASVEADIARLRDQTGEQWAVFGPRMTGLRENALLLIEIQEANCEREMLRRECNVLRVLAESGWEIHQDSVAPDTPQMTSRTPVSLRLRTGSPGFKMPSKRLDFAAADEPSVAVASSVAPAMQSPPSRKAAATASPAALKQPLPKRAMSDEKVFFSLQPAAAAAPAVEAAPPAPVHKPSPPDDVPPQIRSFGSSLSMLQAAFGPSEGLSNVSLSNVSLNSLSLNGSSLSVSQPAMSDHSPLSVAMVPPAPSLRQLSLDDPEALASHAAPPDRSPSVPAAPTAAVGPAMAPRSGVQERLRKMLKARMAAKRDDEPTPGIPMSPSQASLTSPRAEQLAWSPVVAGAPQPDDTLGSVSDLSLMLGDKLGKVSLSFRDEDFAVVDEARAILETRERKIDALKLDIQQLHETVAAKSPARRKGSAGVTDEENLVNKAPSLIPRPGTRSRPGRVLARK